MNIYDFDNTIYRGDSTIDFYLFCLKTHPDLVRYIPIQIWGFLNFFLKRINKTQVKEKFYCFLNGLKNVDIDVERFWNIKINNIKKWYLENQKEDDIIISASPQFLLSFVCNELGIKYLIASKVDKYTGRYLGRNCHGEEKLIRLLKEFPDIQIEAFYSDSLSDWPLALKAKHAFLIKNEKILEWKEEAKRC